MDKPMDKKQERHTDRKADWIALAATLGVSGVAVCLLLCCGLYRPFPPPPEYGVEVNLGYSEFGMGDVQAFEPEASPMPEENVAAESAEEEAVMETSDEEAPALAETKPEEKKEEKAEPEKVPEKPEVKPEKAKEPELNPMALYPGKRKGKEESSQGETQQAGDQGKPEGDVHAQGYEGSGGSGGISFSLNGRTLMSLVKPSYDSDEEGVVVVRIWVNRDGLVTRVQAGVKGTTTMDQLLWKTAAEAAMKSRFVPKEFVPEEQVGTISYRFVRGM